MKFNLAEMVFRLLCRNESEIYKFRYRTQQQYENISHEYLIGRMMEFLLRFDYPVIDVTGKKICDVGCGYGLECLAFALEGARLVCGVDISRGRIEKAICHAHLLGTEETSLFFVGTDRVKASGYMFDYIISKDTFEHVNNPESYLDDIYDLLLPDGLFFLGFGPLWKSPFGAHIRYMTCVPWIHLYINEQIVMQRRNEIVGDSLTKYADVPLNKITLKMTMKYIDGRKWEIVTCRKNYFNSKLKRIFVYMLNLCTFGLLTEYFAFNVYLVLKRRR